jgi:anti-anti-sigma factor
MRTAVSLGILALVQSATERDFSVRVGQVAGTTVVTVVGEVDLDTAPELDFRIARAAAEAGSLVIDLSGVTFFASAGLACLLTAQGDGHRPHLVPSPAVEKVLTLSDLEDFLPCSGSLADALRRIAR